MKTLFGNFYSPYMTEDKIDIDSWYEDYKKDPNKTLIIDSYIYNKIIYRCEFYHKEPYSLIVLIDSVEGLQINDVLIDENNHEYVIKGFEMYSFIKTPEWYPRTLPMLITGSTYNIGSYLRKKNADTVSLDLGQKQKNITKKEYEVLNTKMNNPEKVIKCPRCGNDIIYEKRGNSIAVECKTQNCIYGGIRGL